MEEKPNTTNKTALDKPQSAATNSKGVKIAKMMIVVGIGLIILSLIASLFIKKPEKSTQNDSTATPVVAAVSITKSGFKPQSLTVKKGTVVEWTGTDGSTTHVVAANPHPMHSDLPELVSGELGKGAKYRFTFTQTGTFNYHDDHKPTVNGTIVVTE